MDTVFKLSDVEDNEDAIRLDFEKTRLKTPANADQYQSLIIWPGEGWRCEVVGKEAVSDKPESVQKIVEREFLNTYDRLADGVTKTPGFDFKPAFARLLINL